MADIVDLKKYKIQRAPATNVDTLLCDAAERGYTTAVVLGQDSEGYWYLSFTGVQEKVNLIGMLEFIKMDVFESMN